MKRRDITARWASRLPLAAIILLLGLQACSDTLPPTGPGTPQSTRETLVFYNDLDQVLIDSNSRPWETSIMAVRPDGTARRLVINGFISSAPQNGYMAFYSGPPLGVGGIYRAKDDGKDPQLVVAEQANEYIGPHLVTLAPDGSTIAYIAEDIERGAVLMHVRRGNSIFSTEIAFGPVDETSFCPPVFSRDSRRVATLSWSGDFAALQEIRILSAIDGSVVTFPIGLAGSSFYAMFSSPFDFSPDGRRIAFVGSTESGQEIMTVDLQTGMIDTLTSDSLMEDNPRYLGTTNQILYTAIDPVTFGGSNLYLRDITGGRRQLTFDAEGFKLGLNVSQDGRHASYTESMAPMPGIIGAVRVFDIAKQSAGRAVASSIYGLWRQ